MPEPGLACEACSSYYITYYFSRTVTPHNPARAYVRAMFVLEGAARHEFAYLWASHNTTKQPRLLSP